MSNEELDRQYAALERKIRRPWTSAVNEYPDGFLEIEAERRNRRADAAHERTVNEEKAKAEIAAINKKREEDERAVRGMRVYQAHEINN